MESIIPKRLCALLPAALLIAGLLLLPLPVRAVQIQVGAESVNLTTSKSQDFAGMTTTMPFVAIGGSASPAATYAEVGFLDYTAQGLDTIGAGGTPFTYHVTGTSLALVIADHIQQSVVLRIGVGAILYQYKPTVTPAGQQVYTGQGITTVALAVDDTTGSFMLFGFDFYPFKHVLIGLEYRFISVSPTFKVTGTQGGAPYAALPRTVEDSQGWTGARIAVEF